jgi:4-amino-4-deoxy-L-arabinose transferase-like glycosyltransferase
MKKRKRYITVGGLLVTLLAIRAGEYLLDYTFGQQIGHFTLPWLSLGVFFLYVSGLMAIAILLLLHVKDCWGTHDPSLRKEFPAFSDTLFRIGMWLLVLVTILLTGSLIKNNPNFGAYAYYFPVHNFLNGNGYSVTLQGESSFVPPGYGLLAYLFFLVIRDIELATMLVSAFSYVLSVVLAYYAGKVISGRATGFLAAFFVTFCPVIVNYSYISVIDLCYLFFALLTFLAYLTTLEHPPTYWRYLLLGGLLGYTLLIREQAILLVTGAIGTLFFFSLLSLKRQKQLSSARIWKHLSYPTCTLTMVGLFFVIQIYPLYARTGSWVKSLYVYLMINKASLSAGSLSRVHYHPITFVELAANIKAACKYLVQISAHALTPFILVLWIFFVYGLVCLAIGRAFPFHWNKLRRDVKILGTLGLFMLPMGCLIIFDQVYLRYIMEHSIFLLLLITMLIVRLLMLLSRKYIVYSIALVCMFSFLIVNGALKESRVFKNRIITAGFRFDNWSLDYLEREKVSEGITDRLQPLEWQTFSHENDFWKAVEQYVPREEMLGYQSLLLKYATLSRFERYHTLPWLLMARRVSGVRTAGIWLEHNYTGDLDELRIMGLKAPELLLFYANGRGSFPRGTAMELPQEISLHRVAETMKHEQIDYLVLDSPSINSWKTLKPLWEQPEEALDVRLRLLYKDPQGLCQIYALRQEEDKE